jgi:predicted phosphodiesterase
LATKKIKFYAMGDSPYSQTEKDNLPLQLAKLDANADFMVHLGDMQDRYVLMWMSICTSI